MKDSEVYAEVCHDSHKAKLCRNNGMYLTCIGPCDILAVQK